MRRALVAAALVVASCATAPLPPGTLPTVEFGATSDTPSPYFVVFITGDGGWRKIDVKVSDVLREAGMPVVGLLANKYFAKERTVDETAADVNRLIQEYGTMWHRERVVLVGYSRGADALPLVVNRLPPDTRKSIALVALLGPGLHTGLAMRGVDKYKLLPEVQPMAQLPLVCVYGTHENETLCHAFTGPAASVVAIGGGHHFGGEYGRVAQAILDALNRRS